MEELNKKILSILLGYILIETILKSCNDFHTIKP